MPTSFVTPVQTQTVQAQPFVPGGFPNVTTVMPPPVVPPVTTGSPAPIPASVVVTNPTDVAPTVTSGGNRFSDLEALQAKIRAKQAENK